MEYLDSFDYMKYLDPLQRLDPLQGLDPLQRFPYKHPTWPGPGLKTKLCLTLRRGLCALSTPETQVWPDPGN